MKQIKYREFQKDDLGQMLKIWNTIFPPIVEEDWKRQKDTTAAVAVEDKEIIGQIPLAIREFKINEKVSLKVAFEHAVGVRADKRDKGVGSGMMNAAKEFLTNRCDGMFVYRGNEGCQGDPAYRFYVKNGHIDLHYATPFVLKPSFSNKNGKGTVEKIGIIPEIENQLLDIFHSAYEHFGGYPVRRMGYWQNAFNSIIYSMDKYKYDFHLVFIGEKKNLKAYAIIGQIGDRLDILEFATYKGDLNDARDLFRFVIGLAEKTKSKVRVFSSFSNPYFPLLKELKFLQGKRDYGQKDEHVFAIMGLLLNPEEVAKKVWQKQRELEDVEVKVWTPSRSFMIHSVKGKATRTVTLEMKEETLTRFLLSRLDIKSAIKEERVTVHNGTDREVEVISQGLPFCPWIYHQIDYI